MTIVEIHNILMHRYIEMAKESEYHDKIVAMMKEVVRMGENWPVDKTGRFVGYVQCICIEILHKTTVTIERDFTRPLYHALYTSQGISIPDSVTI